MSLRPTSPTRPITPEVAAQTSPLGFGMLQKLQNFFGKDDATDYFDPDQDGVLLPPMTQTPPKKMRDVSNRPVGVGLPRQTTFKRQNSEKRERLCPVRPLPAERRALSVSKDVARSLAKLRSKSSPAPYQMARNSAPALGSTLAIEASQAGMNETSEPDENEDISASRDEADPAGPRPLRPTSVTSSRASYDRQRDPLDERARINAELDSKWILNLSMHFRDKSDREKFFVTYAERPNRWRRVTVSVDYRNAEPGSLEMDLKELSFQRDKSLQIYESIRESLPEIQFYDTVTNLKLETSDGRLHVHVTEDVNEIIPYPPRSSLAHVLDHGHQRPMACRESDIAFEAHLSGFVYRVHYKGRVYIKKEIPGPDTVDEFLYEVNALNALVDSNHVIQLEGIVLDDTYTTIKGLLISYAEKGAVVDLLYDHKGEITWERRERWARHAVTGLRDIHEEGYVQGDFTLSNIVVDARDNARIIDINRRGCPVGWEPPELAQKIASNQRISMYIGQKSDLYQLGMSLWALAMDDDEPERHDPPLSTHEFPAEVPSWFAEMVRICLSPLPRERLSAKALVEMFPGLQERETELPNLEQSTVRDRLPKQYIDPRAAVERDDLERFRHERDISDAPMYSPQSSREDYTFTYPRSSNYDHDFDGTSSDFERPRGRRRLTDHDALLLARSGQLDQEEVDDGREEEEDNSPPLVGRIARPATLPLLENETDDLEYFGRSWSRGRAPHQHWSQARDHSVEATIDSNNLTAESTTPYHSRTLESQVPAVSETSEATPKTSAIQVAEDSDQLIAGGQARSQTDRDLACIGGHPNIQDTESPGQVPAVPGTNIEEEPVEFLPPQLRFVDSGFNEPLQFGIDDGERRLRRICDLSDDVSDDDQGQPIEEATQDELDVSQPTLGTDHECTFDNEPVNEDLKAEIAPTEPTETLKTSHTVNQPAPIINEVESSTQPASKALSQGQETQHG